VDLHIASKENMEFILEELTKQLDVANHSLFDPDDYDLNKYNDLKSLFDMVSKTGKLSPMETEAFIAELKKIRK